VSAELIQPDGFNRIMDGDEKLTLSPNRHLTSSVSRSQNYSQDLYAQSHWPNECLHVANVYWKGLLTLTL